MYLFWRLWIKWREIPILRKGFPSIDFQWKKFIFVIMGDDIYHLQGRKQGLRGI
jgi:hypothetical protein